PYPLRAPRSGQTSKRVATQPRDFISLKLGHLPDERPDVIGSYGRFPDLVGGGVRPLRFPLLARPVRHQARHPVLQFTTRHEEQTEAPAPPEERLEVVVDRLRVQTLHAAFQSRRLGQPATE